MVKKIDKQELKSAIERKVAQTYEPVKPAVQLGFIHHNVDCIGCRACEIARKDKDALPRDEDATRDDRLRRDERDAAILADKYPLDGADIESLSEYRLASLMQYPHY